MDLSAVIFVVLALAWAVYLIPKALKHHDEMASDRLVEGHSEKVRILSRKAKAAVDALTADEPQDAPASAATAVRVVAPEPVATTAAPTARPTRAAARTAARRRRRVLGLLVLALLVVGTLTWLAYLPIWAPGVPAALVVLWLLLGRLSVRAQQRRHASSSRAGVAPDAGPGPGPGRGREPIVEDGRRSGPAVEEDRARPDTSAEHFLDELAEEDTAGLHRQDLEAALTDEGSLWDPLPMTLPTYVNKARARRTVRTIELTGISSSGHDESDSALAREVDESEETSADPESGQRRVAGA